ncbi:hypothetical protein JCM8547_003835 [Rhodosporidiobolus lusitaniae]
MVRLPDELLEKISEHLEAVRSNSLDVQPAQQNLAALAQIDKQFHRVVNPLEIDLSGEHSSSLFDLPPALLAFGTFSRLTQLAASACFLNGDFLPSVFGPGRPSRETIVNLRATADEFNDSLELPLLFLFEVMSLPSCGPDSIFGQFRKGAPDLLKAVCLPFDDDKDLINVEDEELESFFYQAILDYPSFTLLWSEDPISLCEAKDKGWPWFRRTFFHAHPFTALRILHIALRDVWVLHLIIYTSTFPSLSCLVLEELTSFRIHLIDLQTLRYIITRVETEDRPDGTFLMPASWSADDYFELEAVLGTSLPRDGTLPVLTAKEVQAYPHKPFNGPHLDLLDMSAAKLTVIW